MIFLNFNHFSLIIFYHSVWLGFELFGLRVQVHSIGHSLRSCAKDMTITIVIINPRQEMGLECWWHHTLKRWVENLRILKIPSVEVRPWCWEVDVRPWCWEVGVWPWCWEVKGPTMVLKVDIGPCRQTIELLPLGQRIEFSAIELSFLPLRRRSSFEGPDQRRWIEI